MGPALPLYPTPAAKIPGNPGTSLPEGDAIALLLVRAVEEHDPKFFTPDALAAAALAALDARSDAELLKRRTQHLFRTVPKAVRSWAQAPLLPVTRLKAVVFAAFLLGTLSNYLGPSGVVAIVANPLAILILWNLAVYVWLGISLGAQRAVRSGAAPDRSSTVAASGIAVGGTGPDHSRGHDGLAKFLIPGLWLSWRRWAARGGGARAGIRNTGEVAGAFAEYYWMSARPVVIARIERLLHWGAMGLLLGALAGTYVRGFFFEYNAVWQSTFMSRPESLATLLNVLLGPACLLLDRALLTPDAVQPLLLPQGTNAAAWIHRLALTGVLFVLVPRAVLAGLAARRASSAAARVPVDLEDGYFAGVIRAAREGQIRRVRAGVEETMRRELGRFADAIASYVAERFIDGLIAPTLMKFRQEGGRIADLEAAILELEARFEPELREKLQAEQARLEESIRSDIQAVVGKEFVTATAVIRNISQDSLPTSPEVTGQLATNVGDTVGATVTAAVSVMTATLSGGMGKSAGIAILAGLLHTSGPIGLLIGGIAGMAIAGGAYVLGRDRVTEAVKQWRLPAAVFSMALRDARINELREATRREIRQEIERRTGPAIGETAALMLRRLSESFAARGRDSA